MNGYGILWGKSHRGWPDLTENATPRIPATPPLREPLRTSASGGRANSHARVGALAGSMVEADVRFHRLLRTVRSYLPPAGVELVERAYRRAAAAHQGQVRDSGEPYVNHCVETAHILAEFHLDSAPVTAAILHDVI